MTTNWPSDTFCIMGGQLNGMCTQGVHDRKLLQIENIMSQWDVQACCFQEVEINWSALPHQEQMDAWFQPSQADPLTTTTHKTNELFGPRQ